MRAGLLLVDTSAPFDQSYPNTTAYSEKTAHATSPPQESCEFRHIADSIDSNDTLSRSASTTVVLRSHRLSFAVTSYQKSNIKPVIVCNMAGLYQNNGAPSSSSSGTLQLLRTPDINIHLMPPTQQHQKHHHQNNTNSSSSSGSDVPTTPQYAVLEELSAGAYCATTGDRGIALFQTGSSSAAAYSSYPQHPQPTSGSQQQNAFFRPLESEGFVHSAFNCYQPSIASSGNNGPPGGLESIFKTANATAKPATTLERTAEYG